LPDSSATCALGERIARCVKPGLRVYLSGDLGSGKTTLVRALLHAFGHEGRVKSPTYALVEPYVVSRIHCYHFDFYRFNSPDEWTGAGLDELFDRDAVCLVEWPEKAGDLLPPADLALRFTIAGQGRDVTIEANTEAGERCVSDLRSSPDSS
jgi:tRNA threonylcarbamoyladenosine biosynthesis protein TsaE